MPTAFATSIKKDLIKLGRHFNFSYALENLGKNSKIAFELYKEYSEWKEYNYFEPYKKMALKNAGNNEKSILRVFYRYAASDYESLIHLLVKDFKPQTLQIKLNRETMQPHHTLLVDSVFDIGWFVFQSLSPRMLYSLILKTLNILMISNLPKTMITP